MQKTALITGASVGIGRAFAEELASRAYDLVLVARQEQPLVDAARAIEARAGVAVEVLPADLTDEEGTRTVEARLADHARPIELLINNAGFGTHGRFDELPIENEAREISLNVVALVRLTHAALKPMVKRGRGGVINISSLAGYQATPLNATYAATKAFVTSFTESLHEELRSTGVRTTVVCPGFTRTEFQERAGIDSSRVPSFLWMEADAVARAGIDAWERGKAICVPGGLNCAVGAVAQTMPRSVTRRAAGLIVRFSE